MQNALDAVRDTPGPEIAVRIHAGPETVRVSVEDNGPGIPDGMRDQLFMPFTTTKATGLGLGLVISGDLAREFGGALRLEPQGEGGAAFTLELPRAA
jgi:two-component system C4-dicarboxylate transport sensor histidine kinase DctB